MTHNRFSSSASVLALLMLSGLTYAAHPAQAGALLKPSGSQSQALSAKNLSIVANIKGAFAHTTITTTYANPNSSRIEADFMYSAPEGSVVTGFAYWYQGEKVVARVVEKKRAARIYQAITTRQQDPALIEMVGKNKFRARIFPVEAGQDLKVEIQLTQSLAATKTGALWTYPLRQDVGETPLEQFQLKISSSLDAKSNLGEFSGKTLDVERKNFNPTDDLKVTVGLPTANVRSSLYAARSGGRDGFFSLWLTPNFSISKPSFKISGVSTYDVLAPKRAVKAGRSYVVTGRYRGAGTANVNLNGRALQVKFSNATENPNVAANLWASQKIEALSSSEKNQFQVAQLSKRFGVVSKWTSWLAIPNAERQRFQIETDMADRANAAQAYVQAVIRGDKKTAAAQKVIHEKLAKKLVTLGYGSGQNSLKQSLDNELARLTWALEAEEIPTSRRAQAKQQVATLKRMGAKVTRSTQFAEKHHSLVHQLSNEYAQALIQSGKDSVEARKLKKRLDYSAKYMTKYNGETAQSLVANQLFNLQMATEQQLADLILDGKENGPEAISLQKRLVRVTKETKAPSSTYTYYGERYDPVNIAWKSRAHETAARLRKAREINDAEKVGRLQAKLNKEAKLANISPESALQERMVVRDALEDAPRLAARDYYYSFRPGDPLIAVSAPRDSQRVVAIMPDGSVLPLSFNEEKGVWEARFDVPTYALAGNYSVRILIVAADGSRQQLTMDFNVDVQAPVGRGMLAEQGSEWNLRIHADRHTARVAAFLPWNDRAELRCDKDGAWVTTVKVPTEFSGKQAAVRFVLTDRAHNRTEITVDWN